MIIHVGDLKLNLNGRRLNSGGINEIVFVRIIEIIINNGCRCNQK